MLTGRSLGVKMLAFFASAAISISALAAPTYFDVSKGAHPHDVAAAPGAGAPVYYTAQMTGKLGILDPKTGKFDEVSLGSGSAPHGVVVGPDGAPWRPGGEIVARMEASGERARVCGLGRRSRQDLADRLVDECGRQIRSLDREVRELCFGQARRRRATDARSRRRSLGRGIGERSVGHD